MTRITVGTSLARTDRTLQCEGMFDVPPSERAELTWDVDLPLDERPWNVGMIVGPSGSGKSTIVRELWPEQHARTYAWPDDASVLDGFPDDMSFKDICELLSSVGFSSPPSWLRPFRVLSNGEQFRVTMARVLAENTFAVVDEFTSVVDRTVAQIGSCAIARTVRQRNQQFVAASCHEDILDWLQPDWTYRPDTQDFAWRSVQRRPNIDLDIFRVHSSAWKIFGHHHYLNTSLNPMAQCFVATWRDRPVALSAALSFPHAHRPGYRLSRLVCLPDYQGVGIGVALANTVASALTATGRPVFRTTTHPALIAHCARSPHWKMTRSPGFTDGGGSWKRAGMLKQAATRRLTAGFEYVGPRMTYETARQLLTSEG